MYKLNYKKKLISWVNSQHIDQDNVCCEILTKYILKTNTSYMYMYMHVLFSTNPCIMLYYLSYQLATISNKKNN